MESRAHQCEVSDLGISLVIVIILCNYLVILMEALHDYSCGTQLSPRDLTVATEDFRILNLLSVYDSEACDVATSSPPPPEPGRVSTPSTWSIGSA
jgi:hypothetical protein